MDIVLSVVFLEVYFDAYTWSTLNFECSRKGLHVEKYFHTVDYWLLLTLLILTKN